MLNDFKITEHFNLMEFECKDGNHEVKIGHDLVFALEELRQKLGVPVTIISGYRTPEYNAKVGGASESFHVQGRACDITANVPLKRIAQAAHDLGFTGIGIYPEQNFVHVDNRDSAVYWVKHTNKPYQYMSFEQVMNS